MYAEALTPAYVRGGTRIGDTLLPHFAAPIVLRHRWRGTGL